MKIFVKQLQTSLEFESEISDLVVSHIHAARGLITPIYDHKAKLQLNAEYYVEKAEEFWDFFRIYNAYSITLGGVALLADKIFRLKKASAEQNKLSVEQMAQLQEFRAYLKTDEFSQIMNKIHTVGDTSTLANAYDEIRMLASKISKELLMENIDTNVRLALNFSDKACQAMTAPLRISQQMNERMLSVFITESGKKVIIHFNGSEKEYELLDNWMSTPELKLEVMEGANFWKIKDVDSFVKWFNALRTRLESECSYQTFCLMLNHMPETERDKYKNAVQERIAIISASNAENIVATRKKVISYLHQLLNKRKGHQLKHFSDFNADDLNAHWNDRKGVYILSLYQ